MTYEHKHETEPTAPADEIEIDLQVLRHLRTYNDLKPLLGESLDGRSSRDDDSASAEQALKADQALKNVTQKLEAEIDTSEQIASDWTEALSPLLHGDDPEMIKGIFKDFNSWAAEKRRKDRIPDLKVQTPEP
jgi:hypothetical protein